MSLMSLFGCKQQTIQLRVACLRKLPWKDLINYDKTKVSVFSQFSLRNFILESLKDKLYQGMIHCGRYDQTLTSPVICVDVPIGLHCDYTIDQTLHSALKAMGTNISGSKWKQLEQIRNWQINVSFMRPINLR